MLLVHSLIKSVILLAYILNCLNKYTSRGCAYFIVLGGMIFKSTSFPPKASSSTCSPYVQTGSHKFLAKLSINVDSKLTEKGLQVFFRHPPTHTCIYEDIWRAFPFIIKISALRVASTMTPAVTSRARLHRSGEKQHSPAHSEVLKGPVLKFHTYMFVRTQILHLLDQNKQLVNSGGWWVHFFGEARKKHISSRKTTSLSGS